MWFVVLLTSVASAEVTTTKKYSIEVPGTRPITIIEGQSLWKTKKRSTDDPLQQFLTTYAETVRHNRLKNRGEREEYRLNFDDSTEKGKSWSMSNRNHPFDDKKGWVSLEPVPWSVSKISKWQSKYKPEEETNHNEKWDEYDSGEEIERPWKHPYDTNQKPSAIYKQKVSVNYGNRFHHGTECDRHSPPKKHLFNDGEIITDGLPVNFPKQYGTTNRRQGTDFHPDTHPFSGEGEWVLLSTTKGYKYPHERQRSMQINPDAIGAHRGVHLTVLPPLKNSKVNMTTSHGGLLQVESTFQTVEQSRKQFTKKPQKKKNKVKKPNRQLVPASIATTQRNTSPDSSAIMAAVGAGMIPATMAMLVPMALGGRRKRYITQLPKYQQITIPR